MKNGIILSICIILLAILVSVTSYYTIKNEKEKNIVNKSEEANLIFSFYSMGINKCPGAILEVYDDNTYKYIYEINVDENIIKYNSGSYSYDVSKILESISNNNLDEEKNNDFFSISYILTDNEGKVYEFYNMNEYLSAFIKEINIDLNKCLKYYVDVYPAE